MQRIVTYFIENSNRLLFFLLLGFSMVLTIQQHAYHRSQFVGSANSVNGAVYEQIYQLKLYLSLKTENEMLVKENLKLKTLLYNNEKEIPELKIDTSFNKKKFNIFKANVINNTYSSLRNFITLDVGEKQGVKTDMAVMNSKGIIGVVEKTSENYSTVKSLLNIKTEINAIIRGTNHFGTLTWNGKDFRYMQLIDIPRVAKVRKGDVVVTGGMSAIFPENLPIGVISKVFYEKNTNYYIIQVKLFNDMTNLGHAYVIENKNRFEIQELEKTTNDLIE
jgi:rod shape-determining protein MreC